MWFKQIQLYALNDLSGITVETLTEKLNLLQFEPCTRSMASTMGWVPLLDEENAPLAEMVNGNLMVCLQIEEKILPGSVVRQELNEKIKQIQIAEHRKVSQKEKLTLKDEVTHTLLTRAFSKLTKIYAYIDTKNQWLVLGTTSPKKTEQFMSMFKKSVAENIYPIAIKKLSPIMTNWLKDKDYPSSFSIEKSCVLQDQSQQKRIIRCQQQDLFAASIQELIKDGCEVKQFALIWQDRLNFTLTNDFLLQSIKFHDEITAQAREMGAETEQHKFHVDFLIMGETLSGFLKDLLQEFAESAQPESPPSHLNHSEQKTEGEVATI